MPNQPSRLDNLRSIRYANIDMAFYTAFSALTTGSFLVKLVQHLHGSPVWIGMLSAIPSLCGILQIPGAIWGRRYASYKKFVTPGWLLWRVFYIPIVFLPLLLLSDAVKLWVVAICMVLSYCAVFVANPVFFEWLTELIPATSRGWLFGRRNAIAAPTGAIVGLLGGWIIDRLTSHPSSGKEFVNPIAFALVFGIAVAAGLVGQVFFSRMHDLQRAKVVRESFIQNVQAFTATLKDRDFVRALTFLVVFTGGLNFASNFFADFAFKSLEMPMMVLQIATLVHSAGNLLASRYWGFLGDKYGNKPMLVLAGIGMLITPIPWLFCTPGYSNYNNILIVSCHFFMGVIWSGVAVCQFNLLLATANPKDRASYLGVGMAIQSLVGGISPILGGLLFYRLQTLAGPSPEALANAYKTLFIITMAIRLIAILLIFRVKEPGSKTIGEMLRAVGSATPRGIMALRRLGRSSDVQSREEAIQTVGSSHVAFAEDEVIRALHDPSPRVRRQAATTLSKLEGSKETIEALVHILDDHPDLVDEETIEALGALGDPSVIPNLAPFLESPRSLIRQATAKSIGQLGGPEAVEFLMRTATNTEDHDLRRTSINSLRILEAREASKTIVAALLDSAPSVRNAAAEAVAELEITSAAVALRTALDRFPEQQSSEIAYALGAVGQIEDATLILDEASHCESVITRGRCLLGLARLFGVETAYYRLMLQQTRERDSAIIEMLKGNEEAIRAFETYLQGDEVQAIRQLAQLSGKAELEILVQKPVKDSFLLAVCLMTKK
jgi:HEAT repeat protein/MFS family permease